MIRLSRDDVQFLTDTLDLGERLRSKFSRCSVPEIELDDQDADELRDLCGERLQTHGFDEKYQPTEEGRRLENLIDKLFIG